MDKLNSEIFNIDINIKKRKEIYQWDENEYYDSPGVYIFYDKNRTVLYVGESANIKDRLKQHLSGYYKTTKILARNYIFGIEMFEVGDESNSIDRKIFELYKIRELKPIANIKNNDKFSKERFEDYIINSKYSDIRIDNWPKVELFAMKYKISIIEAKIIALWCINNKKDYREINANEWIEEFGGGLADKIEKSGIKGATFNSKEDESRIENDLENLYEMLGER